MGLAPSFDNPTLLRRHVADAVAEGRLAIVLGAGVSAAMGLPTWPKLLEVLFAHAECAQPAGLTLERQAEYYRVQCCAKDTKKFLANVRAALYATVNADLWALRKNAVLAAVGNLARAAHRENSVPVITFNFDDLLELYLEYHGVRTRAEISPVTMAGNVDVRVLHPHGLMPYDSNGKASGDIVFDQRAFSAIVVGEVDRWKEVLRGILRTHLVLFIGLSGVDGHLDALLEATLKEHVTTGKYPYWGVRLAKAPTGLDEEAMNIIWKERGVYTYTVASYDVLASELFEICRLAAPRIVE